MEIGSVLTYSRLVKTIFCWILLAIGLVTVSVAESRERNTARFPLWRFDQTQQGCRAKGRFQDKDYCSSTVVDEIIAMGKDSIPILISQLTETRDTQKPIFDYWSHTSSGDIAYLLLTSLFTDKDWKTSTIDGPPNWNVVMKGCEGDSEQCWRRYVKQHGIKAIQNRWMQSWNKYKDHIRWDESARCFRTA
jgi:hypothetical protein